MVILKWINSILTGNRVEVTQSASAQGAEKKRRTETRRRSVDLINAALVDRAENFDQLITTGSQQLARKNIKRKVKQKVQAAIADEFNNPDLIEEVTERITDAAEVDPYYNNLFCGDR